MSTHIHVKLFATLSRFTPQNPEAYPLAPGTTVREVVHQLGIPEEKAKLIFIDGKKETLEATLQGGERLGIFPPVGGG